MTTSPAVRVPVAGRVALNSWTLDATPLTEVVHIACEAGYAAIEVRSIDFDRAADREVATLAVRDCGLPVSSLGANGILVQAGPREQSDWFAGLEGTAALALAIGCDTIMVSTGMQNATTVAAAAALLRTAAGIVGSAGLRLAYEFNAFHPSINDLGRALDLLSAADAANLGLALDSYHLQRSGSVGMLPSIARERLFCVQISDVPASAGAQAPPLDRLTPGQGAVDWTRLFRFLDAIGYGGWVAVESPNPAIWERDARLVAAESLASVTGLWERARRPA